MIRGYLMVKVFRFSFFMAERKKKKREKEVRVKDNTKDK